MIATQQSTAQTHGWSLEELELQFNFDPAEDELERVLKEETGFVLTELSIESAEYFAREKRIKLSNKLSSVLPTIILQWVKKEAEPAEGEGEKVDEFVYLPVYLNRLRKHLLTSVKIPSFGLPDHIWYQRGVAIFA